MRRFTLSLIGVALVLGTRHGGAACPVRDGFDDGVINECLWTGYATDEMVVREEDGVLKMMTSDTMNEEARLRCRVALLGDFDVCVDYTWDVQLSQEGDARNGLQVWNEDETQSAYVYLHRYVPWPGGDTSFCVCDPDCRVVDWVYGAPLSGSLRVRREGTTFYGYRGNGSWNLVGSCEGFAGPAFAQFWSNNYSNGLASFETRWDSFCAEADNYVIPGSSVVDRHVFYNNSAFDGSSPAADQQNDDAIACDKDPLLPGQTATFVNYTSYSRGINGIMVDIADVPDWAILGADDFRFKVGNDHTTDDWDDAPNPIEIALRRGDGLGDSDRVTIIWADNDWETPTAEPGAIANEWLQVTVLPTADTGLCQPDVFYFGNAVGEAGNSAVDALVTSQDEILARNNPHGPFDRATIHDPYDYNRDELVSATDQIIARNNTTGPFNCLNLITVPECPQCTSRGTQATAVPEPGTLALLATCALTLLAWAARRKTGAT